VPQPRVTRAEETYRYLLDEVLRGRWQAGDIVSTNALAEELKLSRTPVLQALKRLESDGIVEVIPQVGCRILKATGGALADLFAIRTGLEGVAAAVAALELDEDELASLEVTLRRLDESAADGDNEVLLVTPREADPALDDRLMTLLATAGHRFRHVRRTTGEDARSLLLAVAEQHGVAVAAASIVEILGDIVSLVVPRRFEPALRLPDTALAWRAGPPPELQTIISSARQAAAMLYAEQRDHREGS
jgi:DNA-binding GntR family transcriptional regulator